MRTTDTARVVHQLRPESVSEFKRAVQQRLPAIFDVKLMALHPTCARARARAFAASAGRALICVAGATQLPHSAVRNLYDAVLQPGTPVSEALPPTHRGAHAAAAAGFPSQAPIPVQALGHSTAGYDHDAGHDAFMTGTNVRSGSVPRDVSCSTRWRRGAGTTFVRLFYPHGSGKRGSAAHRATSSFADSCGCGRGERHRRI